MSALAFASDGYTGTVLIEDLDIARDRLDRGVFLLNQAIDLRSNSTSASISMICAPRSPTLSAMSTSTGGARERHRRARKAARRNDRD